MRHHEVAIRTAHRRAHRGKTPNRRSSDAQGDIDIVDQQIEDDVYVRNARGRWTAATCADRQHTLVLQDPSELPDCGVESLDVSDLQDHVMLISQPKEVLRLSDRARNRLLDK